MTANLISLNLVPYLGVSWKEANETLAEFGVTETITPEKLLLEMISETYRMNNNANVLIITHAFGADAARRVTGELPTILGEEKFVEIMDTYIDPDIHDGFDYPEEFFEVVREFAYLFDEVEKIVPDGEVAELEQLSSKSNLFTLYQEVAPHADHAHINLVAGEEMDVYQSGIFFSDDGTFVAEDPVLVEGINQCVPLDYGSMTIRFHSHDEDKPEFTVIGYEMSDGQWKRVRAKKLMQAYSYDSETGEELELEDNTLYTESSMFYLEPGSDCFSDTLAKVLVEKDGNQYVLGFSENPDGELSEE